MPIFIDTGEGAVCKNSSCENYKSYEEYEFIDAKDDGYRTYYVCRGCGEKIYVD